MNPDGTKRLADEARLESWKEIGAYLQRNAVTARRWEKEEGLPVHRHSHKSRASVYAYPSEIDAWRASRRAVPEPPPLWKTLLAPPRSLAFGVTMALCLVMVGNGLRPQKAEAQNASASERLVWSETAFAYGDISQDGRYLPFADAANGELAIRDLQTGTNRRISFLKKNGWIGDYGNARGGVMSPDNSRVAFGWYAPRGHWALRVAEVNGDPSKLKTVTADGERNMQPYAWTPDGESLVVVRGVADSTRQLGFLSVSSGKFRSLKSLEWRWPTRVSLSPDGRYLAYDLPKGTNSQRDIGGIAPRDIFVLAADGSSETLVVSGAPDDYAPMWSPDGAHIVFTSDRTPNQSLWAIPIRNGKATGPERMVRNNIGGTVLGITRGGALYFVPRASIRRNVHVVEMDANAKPAKPATLAVDTTVNSNISPSWSPDGESLAYFAATGPNASQFQLMVRSIKTGESRLVPIPSKLRLIAGSPTWFPDNRSVMVMAMDDDNRRAQYRVDVATGKPEISFSGGSSGGVISGDGRFYYYGGGDAKSGMPALIRRELATGNQVSLGITDSVRVNYGDLDISPDGTKLAYILDDSQNQSKRVEVMPIAGGKPRVVYEAAGWLEGASLAWTRDQRYLLFVQRFYPEQDPQPGVYVLRVPVDGGPAERTGIELKGAPSLLGISNLEVGPDGRRLAYGTRDETATEMWALENFLPPAK